MDTIRVNVDEIESTSKDIKNYNDNLLESTSDDTQVEEIELHSSGMEEFDLDLAYTEQEQSENYQTIEEIEANIQYFNGVLAEYTEELQYKQLFEDMTSEWSSVVNYFPECLYDLEILKNISEDEYEIILNALVYIGIETDPYLTYDDFKQKVESGEYINFLYDFTGSSLDYTTLNNIETILPTILNYYSCTEDIDKMLDYDYFLNDEQWELYEEWRTRVRTSMEIGYDDFSNDAIAYAVLLGYSEEEFFTELEALANTDSLSSYNQKLICEGKSEILSEFLNIDDVKSQISDKMDDYNKGNITEEELQSSMISIIEESFLESHPEYVGYGQSSQFGKFINSNDAQVLIEQGLIKTVSLDDLKSDFNLALYNKLSAEHEELKADVLNLKTMIQMLEYQKKDLELSTYIDADDYDEYAVEPRDLNFEYLDMETVQDLHDPDSFKSIYDRYKEVMAEEELGKLFYLYNKFGEEKALEYIEIKEEEWNSIIGLERAYEWVNNYLEVNGELKAFEDLTPEEMSKLEDLGLDSSDWNHMMVTLKAGGEGIESFCEGLANNIAGDGKLSANDYERLYIQMFLASNEALSMDYTISSSIGNMLIPMVVGAAAGAATKNKKIGEWVGAILMGLSASGNAFEGALQSGENYWQARFYGCMTGASEIALERFIGGIPAISELDNIPGLKGRIISCFSESGEEMSQTVLDYFLRGAIFGEEVDIDWNEVSEAGFYAFVTAGILQGGKLFINNTVIQLKDLNPDFVKQIIELEEEGVDIDYERLNEIAYLESLGITASMTKATLTDWTTAVSQEEISSALHSVFDGRFGEEYVDSVIDSINIIELSEWENFKSERNLGADVVGFVDENGDIYFPSNANMHTVIHEAFHKASTWQGNTWYNDQIGQHQIVTGIREVYQNEDGTYYYNTLANETLTDYLASKYSDNKVYTSRYDLDGTVNQMWEKLDELLYEKYGENTILLDAYLNNDPASLRKIFDEYAYDGAYDNFVIAIENLNDSEANNIIDKIEKNITPSVLEKIISKIKGIFGGNE